MPISENPYNYLYRRQAHSLRIYMYFFNWNSKSKVSFRGKLYSLIMAQNFIKEASDEIESIIRLQASTLMEFSSMVSYFGEDAEKMETNEVFEIFAEFVRNFEVNNVNFWYIPYVTLLFCLLVFLFFPFFLRNIKLFFFSFFNFYIQ